PVDTIVGGIPAYTGRSAGWQYADFEWFWMMLVKGQDRDIYMGNLELRFTALSDSSAVPTEGWMIDDMQIVLYECFGNVEDLQAGEFLSKAYPNPGSGDIRIETDASQAEALILQVFSRDGAVMESKSVQPGEPLIIRASRYPSGLYSYRLTTGNGKCSEGRFIKI
ncbi:MAG: T9SS type A sorting domain-containing protein, partial [Bacteroidales bacterium]